MIEIRMPLAAKDVDMSGAVNVAGRGGSREKGGEREADRIDMLPVYVKRRVLGRK